MAVLSGEPTRVALRVAALDCQVCFVGRPPALADDLRPFVQSRAAAEPDLALTIGPGLPGVARDRGEGAMMRTRHLEGEWRFSRPAGELRCVADFARGEVSCAPASRGEPFDGRPWLLLALWGYLARRGGALLHGALVELAGRCLLLLGPSGVGKTTLARLVQQAGGSCPTDEYPLLTRGPTGPLAHATPWPGMTGVPAALSAPPDTILLLAHGAGVTARRLELREGARRLLEQVRCFTWDPSTIPATLELVDRVAREVPIFAFAFAPLPAAVAALRELP